MQLFKPQFVSILKIGSETRPCIIFFPHFNSLFFTYYKQVCFSCRAFWRRAHKRTKVPNFSCSRDENCVITVTNRRKCKRCRYRLCQIAGMTESAILTEEQKKMRFRKMIQKREQVFFLCWHPCLGTLLSYSFILYTQWFIIQC